MRAAARELADDPRFATNPPRVRNRDTLVPLLAAMVLERSRDEWIAALEAVGVPCGPINDIADVFDDPQVKARALRDRLPHPSAGTVKLVRSPMRMSATPAGSDLPPPMLGQHTDEVLHDLLGKSAAEIAALHESGVL